MNARFSLPERKRHYDQAMRSFKDKDYAAAARTFSQICTNEDLCGLLSQFFAGESYLHLGLEHMGAGQYAAASSSFTLASKLNPRHERLPHFLACCFARLGRFDQAARCSDREARLRPDDTAPVVRFAVSQWLDGQQQWAMHTLRDGVRSQPDNAELHFQLGVMLAAREEYEEAIVALKKTLQIAPDRADALFHLALCHGARNDRAAAAGLLREAQRLRPHDAQIALYLALASEGLGGQRAPSTRLPAVPKRVEPVDIADVEELTRIIRDEPEVAEAFADLQDREEHRSVFELLAAVLDRAILAEPLCAELHYHQARIYKRLGRGDKAIASCERAIEIDPQLVQGLVTLARLYLDADRQSAARLRFQQVLDLGYRYADVYFHLGCIHRDRGESGQARESYSRALEINSGYTEARAALESLAA